MFAGFIKVGGFEPVSRRYMDSIPNTTIYYHMAVPNNYPYKDCGIPSDTSFHFFRPASDSNIPWPGMVFGVTISAVWYWCSDQVRCLSKLSLLHCFTLVFLCSLILLLIMMSNLSFMAYPLIRFT